MADPAPNNDTYITYNDETATLPQSKQLIGGDEIEFLQDPTDSTRIEPQIINKALKSTADLTKGVQGGVLTYNATTEQVKPYQFTDTPTVNVTVDNGNANWQVVQKSSQQKVGVLANSTGSSTPYSELNFIGEDGIGITTVTDPLNDRVDIHINGGNSGGGGGGGSTNAVNVAVNDTDLGQATEINFKQGGATSISGDINSGVATIVVKSPGDGGTVTQVDTVSGELTGGLITTTGTLGLADTPVIAGNYISPNIVIDSKGRIISSEPYNIKSFYSDTIQVFTQFDPKQYITFDKSSNGNIIPVGEYPFISFFGPYSGGLCRVGLKVDVSLVLGTRSTVEQCFQAFVEFRSVSADGKGPWESFQINSSTPYGNATTCSFGHYLPGDLRFGRTVSWSHSRTDIVAYGDYKGYEFRVGVIGRYDSNNSIVINATGNADSPFQFQGQSSITITQIQLDNYS